MSQWAGFVCSLYIPKPFRSLIYGTFGNVYGVKFHEMGQPIDSFPSFNQFFTRALKKDARMIEDEGDITSLCSPCDGTVLSISEIDSANFTFECVKGLDYSLEEFMLGSTEGENRGSVKELISKVSARGNKLYASVIYLAPGDYHRFHSCGSWSALSRRHIPGYLAPVKPSYVAGHKDVFKTNERVNIFGQWAKGFMMTSFVGALNVGSIRLHFDPTLTTNKLLPTEIEEDYHYT